MNNQQSGGLAGAIPALPFSESVKAGSLLFISGQVGVVGPSGEAVTGAGTAGFSFEQEVRQVISNLGAVLERQGLGYGNLVQVTIYLTDIEDYSVMNRVYAGYFTGGFPTRVTVAVKELALKARIEMSGIALLG